MYPIQNLTSSTAYNDNSIELGYVTKGLSPQDKSCIMSLLIKLSSEERKSVLTNAAELIRDDTSLEDRILIINELIVIPFERREEYIDEIYDLDIRLGCQTNSDFLQIIKNLSGMSLDDKLLLIQQYYRLHPQDFRNTTKESLNIFALLRNERKENRDDLVNQSLRLITTDMSNENREIIVKNLSEMDVEERKLLVEDYFTLVLKENISSWKKAYILTLLKETSSIERKSLIQQYYCLCPEECRNINKSLNIFALLKNERDENREDLVIQALRLITTDMSNENREIIVKNLSEMDVEERKLLVEDYFTLVPEEEILPPSTIIHILTLLKQVSSAERKFIIELYSHLSSLHMDIHEKTSLLDFLIKMVPDQLEREDLISHSFRLITNDMKFNEIFFILTKIKEILPEFRIDLVRQTFRLITEDMTARDRIFILSYLKDGTHRNNWESLVTQALRLITVDMTAQDRISIMSSIKRNRSHNWESLVTQALRLINNSDLEDRLRILIALSVIPSDTRPFLLTKTLNLINAHNCMHVEERLCLLWLVSSAMSRDQHNLHLYLENFSRELASSTYFPEDWFSITSRNQQLVETVLDQLLNRVEKKQFIIHSREVIEAPLQVISHLYTELKKNDIRLLPNSINYIDSQAIDEGGVIRSFVTTLMKSLCDPKYSLVTGPESSVIPILNTSSSLSLEDKNKYFEIIGRFFSAGMQKYKSIVVGQHFDPIVFEMIFNLSAEDMAKVDSSEVFDKMLKIYILQQLNASEEVAESLVQDNITDELRDIYCIDSRDQFIEENELDQKIHAVISIAKSMYQSLSNKARWVPIKGASADALREKIQGVISRESIQNSFRIDRRDGADTASVEYLKKWVAGTNSQMLQKFVEAISGMKTLMPHTSLTIAGKAGIDKLPEFHTCFFRIDVSRYSSYEAFKEKLEISLDHCLVGSGFQMA